jgi:uncharacterized protein
MASTLVVNVVDLLRRPGSQKQVSLRVAAELFDFADSRIDDAGLIDVWLQLESSSTGVNAHGAATAAWKSGCRRCLRPVHGVVEAEIDEVFSREVSARRGGAHAASDSTFDGEAEPLAGDQIDFTLPVREAILLAVPAAPLCRDDCPGLCPQCGADLATTSCSCVVVVRDERWAALDALRDTLTDASGAPDTADEPGASGASDA